MNKIQVQGVILAVLGYLILGYLWGGPGAENPGTIAKIGPYVAILLFVIGIIVFVVGSVKKAKQDRQSKTKGKGKGKKKK